jgi:hypothetical protein
LMIKEISMRKSKVEIEATRKATAS